MAKIRSKTALVLAGGGLTGAVYEIGALRAIDDLLIDRTVNDFDVYVGTSSGALVGTLLASGISPEEMLQVINGTHPNSNWIERRLFFNINRSNIINWLGKFPVKLGRTLETYISELDDMAVFDLFWSFSNLLPAGFYDGTSLGNFIRQGLDLSGFPDQFQALTRELYIIATDLDNGKRAVFGRGYLESAISEAVSASCAVPLLYQPVRINGRDYIDGSLRGNTSIDLAIEHGANLIVVINPMVPYNLDQSKDSGSNGNRIHKISDGGTEAIANQLIRIILHSNVHYHIKQIQRSRKDIDIILIEPNPDDLQMFSHNIMRYSSRLAVAQHGFEAVTLNLAEKYPVFKEILGRHDIPINHSLVMEELNEITNSNFDPEVDRWKLGTKSSGNNNLTNDRLMTRLDLSLSKLELALDRISARD